MKRAHEGMSEYIFFGCLDYFKGVGTDVYS